MSERLEDGCSPETPIGDNVVHAFVTGDAEWMEASAKLAGDGSPPLTLRLPGGEAPPGPDELVVREVVDGFPLETRRA